MKQPATASTFGPTDPPAVGGVEEELTGGEHSTLDDAVFTSEFFDDTVQAVVQASEAL